MSVPKDLQSVANAIRSAPLQSLPHPWRAPHGIAVGGLECVGFFPGSDHLLVVSSQGRGVFDCRDGRRLARDREETGDWIDDIDLSAVGIGPLSGHRIRMSGLHGGGLPISAGDGWSIAEFVLDWPEYTLVVTNDYRDVYELRLGRQVSFFKLAVETELRAYGFSPTGRSLVIATSSDLIIYSRE